MMDDEAEKVYRESPLGVWVSVYRGRERNFGSVTGGASGVAVVASAVFGVVWVVMMMEVSRR